MEPVVHARWTPRDLIASAGWVALICISALGWYATGRGLAFRLGFDDVATGIGVVAAGVVALTLMRWLRGDAEDRALAELRCPICQSGIETRHEHAAATMPGRQLWSCAACGFARIAPLTCDRCAT